MKLVSFNIWGGTIYGPLMDYLKKLSADTDVFCFQEVFSSLPGAPKESSGARMFLFEELTELLTDFTGMFDLRSSGHDFENPVNAPVSHGLAVFIKKHLAIEQVNSKLITFVNHKVDALVKAQIIKVAQGGKKLAIINFHGIAEPGDKLDTPERIGQSNLLAQIWKSLGEGAKILTGDFNLMPQTESVSILENCGRNLIKDFGIQSTRNKISWERFSNKQSFADYCFVSPDVKVKSFAVPYNEISDHLPMILEFEI